MESAKTVIGIDVGTSGVRAVAANATGAVLAEAERPLFSDRRGPDALHEQDPEEWWIALSGAAQSIMTSLKRRGAPVEVAGVAVTSTSGSLVAADLDGHPLRPAILYDDGRGVEIAEELNRQAPPDTLHLSPSYSVVKAAWVRQAEPDVWTRTRHLLHPADWLAGKLTGQFGISDHSNALKLGYDPESGGWGEAVSRADLPNELLPCVFRPGQEIGRISSQASAKAGLPTGTPVLAGATDGIASLIASGASLPGHANTTLGTTLVWKSLTKGKPKVAPGVYCHLHPSGLWAPGAASNTGPGSLAAEEPAVSGAELDKLAAAYLPTRVVCYMLRGRGERFPFVNRNAETFVEGGPRQAGEWYAAQLQSLAFVERWGYEVLEKCGVEPGEMVFSTGGAAASPILSQLRSHVLNRVVVRCRYPTAAFGAAILAASGTLYSGDVSGAIQAMTTICESYSPSRPTAQGYDETYGLFRDACARRGYAS